MAAEKNFENKLKKFLKDRGCWYIKYWAGAKFTKDGIPDILACWDGKFIAIEVKAPKGKPSLLQIVTLRKIQDAGGIGVLLYPSDFKGFQDLLNGKPEGLKWYIKNMELQDNWYDRLNA